MAIDNLPPSPPSLPCNTVTLRLPQKYVGTGQETRIQQCDVQNVNANDFTDYGIPDIILTQISDTEFDTGNTNPIYRIHQQNNNWYISQNSVKMYSLLISQFPNFYDLLSGDRRTIPWEIVSTQSECPSCACLTNIKLFCN